MDESFSTCFKPKPAIFHFADWRTGISGQMTDLVFNAIRHPNIDNELYKKAVLVTTGKLADFAAVDFQGFKDGITRSTQNLSVELWSGSNLVDRFEQYGLTGIHWANSQGYAELSSFLLSYSRALDGSLSVRNIEEYSLYWAKETDSLTKRLLKASIEAEIISQQCVEHQRYYEAIFTQVALLRTVSSWRTQSQLTASYPCMREMLPTSMRSARRGWSRCVRTGARNAI